MGTKSFFKQVKTVAALRIREDLREAYRLDPDILDDTFVPAWVNALSALEEFFTEDEREYLSEIKYAALPEEVRTLIQSLVADELYKLSAISQRVFATSIELPHKNQTWKLCKSLSVYTLPGGERSYFGGLVNRYKYSFRTLSETERRQIEEQMTIAVSIFVKNELSPIGAFDACISPPSNNSHGINLPMRVCELLSERHRWLADINQVISRTRQIEPVKFKTEDSKRAELKNLYQIDYVAGHIPQTGILVIDDVFTSGATSDEIFDSLENAYPSIPKFLVTFTHTNELKKAKY
jgi:hypothetical protein